MSSPGHCSGNPIGSRCLLALIGTDAPGAALLALLEFLARHGAEATMER